MLFISGNKLDIEDREIPTEVGEQFAQRHNMYYLETSAKEAENVEKLFIQIAAELMEVIFAIHSVSPSTIIFYSQFFMFTASSL